MIEPRVDVRAEFTPNSRFITLWAPGEVMDVLEGEGWVYSINRHSDLRISIEMDMRYNQSDVAARIEDIASALCLTCEIVGLEKGELA